MDSTIAQYGQCALYGFECDLQQSHIIPKFAYTYLKRTGSRFMRRLVEPSQRMQDGIKIPLLSKKAESEFSKNETYFKNKIFDEINKKDSGYFDYDERFYAFIVSVLWRVVQLEKTKGFRNLTLTERNTIKNCDKKWSEFLRNERSASQLNNVYAYVCGERIANHNFGIPDSDYYMTRAIDCTIIYSNRGSYLAVYAKFGRFFFWSVLNGRGGHKLTENRIEFKPGRFHFPKSLVENNFGNFLFNRITQINTIGYKLSPNQENVVLEEMKKHLDPYSDLAESMLNDIRLRNNRSTW